MWWCVGTSVRYSELDDSRDLIKLEVSRDLIKVEESRDLMIDILSSIDLSIAQIVLKLEGR